MKCGSAAKVNILEIMMLEFRKAAAAGNLLALEELSLNRGNDFNIDEPDSKSGKTAAHFAAEGAHFEVIYWLFEQEANFYQADNAGKTAIDYLQQKEFTAIDSGPMLKGHRQYYLCNAHYKIWLAHTPTLFMPYLYQDDFRQYRENNPNGYMSLVYSKTLLNDAALSELVEFAAEYQISLISFENDLKTLTDQFGTKEDKLCYQLASYELSQYPNHGGGNLAVVADLIRWSSVLLRIGSYSDTDVEVGQHKWLGSIPRDKSLTLNLGTLIYPSHQVMPWLNGDIIAVSSLFSRPHPEGILRITLSKTACFMIQQVQLSLLASCSQQRMERRIATQQFVTKTFSDFSLYLKDFFTHCGSASFIADNFTPGEVLSIQGCGLESFSSEQQTPIIERVANLMRRKIEKDFETPEMARQYSRIFQNTKNDEHEKFLMNYMQAMQMTNIKEGIRQLTGSHIFFTPIGKHIIPDSFKRYSIYFDETTQSAFRSTNTVKFDTPTAEIERVIKTQKCADLSFTAWGMADVMQRSQDLQEEHQKAFRRRLS